MKRVNQILGQLDGQIRECKDQAEQEGVAGKSSLTVVDNRNGKTYEWPIENGTVSAKDIYKTGIRPYDPGFANTCAAKSKITWIDGPKGILRYRGYPIEQLATQSTFMEVSYLLLYGQLPSQRQLTYFKGRVMRHTFVHSNLKEMMKTFRYDAHPMGMLTSSLASLSTFHPEANPALAGDQVYKSQEMRNKQIHRILGNVPTIAAYAYRHRIGRPYVDPRADLGYAENFLYMLDYLGQPNYKVHPKLAKALDVLFILHADHELNASTSAMRHVTSAGTDVYTSLAASAGTLYGPSHGGANEAVLRMLERIGSVENIPAFMERVKARKEKLMGFGHRVYKNYDPRATLVRKLATEVFEILGKEPLIEIATALEKVALEDPYFVKRKLYPNVDFYSGLIYKAMGFPTDYFTVLFAIPRTVGWLAHWSELLDDKDKRIVRPRQVYLGEGERTYHAMQGRQEAANPTLASYATTESKRRNASTDL